MCVCVWKLFVEFHIYLKKSFKRKKKVHFFFFSLIFWQEATLDLLRGKFKLIVHLQMCPLVVRRSTLSVN